MRKQATKLEVGKWYADLQEIDHPFVNFLRYHSLCGLGRPRFDLQKEHQYGVLSSGFIEFADVHAYYIPTEEDVENYNLR